MKTVHKDWRGEAVASDDVFSTEQRQTIRSVLYKREAIARADLSWSCESGYFFLGWHTNSGYAFLAGGDLLQLSLTSLGLEKTPLPLLWHAITEDRAKLRKWLELARKRGLIVYNDLPLFVKLRAIFAEKFGAGLDI